ncbi:MAG: hypothetical protein AAB425_02360, partial [Bdellovibrionota bacterium]
MPQFKDTMMMARDFKALVRFYNEFVGMSIVESTEHWTMLRDEKTGQSLCITNGPSVRTTSPGIEVEDLEVALGELKRLGGSVHKTWE